MQSSIIPTEKVPTISQVQQQQTAISILEDLMHKMQGKNKQGHRCKKQRLDNNSSPFNTTRTSQSSVNT
eukprot:15344798-Ditylum_brightwellii.AAC.1